MQFYTDVSRKDVATSLPDAETFCSRRKNDVVWYWQSCYAGCLLDGYPIGPFDTEALAIAGAREGMNE